VNRRCRPRLSACRWTTLPRAASSSGSAPCRHRGCLRLPRTRLLPLPAASAPCCSRNARALRPSVLEYPHFWRAPPRPCHAFSLPSGARRRPCSATAPAFALPRLGSGLSTPPVPRQASRPPRSGRSHLRPACAGRFLSVPRPRAAAAPSSSPLCHSRSFLHAPIAPRVSRACVMVPPRRICAPRPSRARGVLAVLVASSALAGRTWPLSLAKPSLVLPAGCAVRCHAPVVASSPGVLAPRFVPVALLRGCIGLAPRWRPCAHLAPACAVRAPPPPNLRACVPARLAASLLGIARCSRRPAFGTLGRSAASGRSVPRAWAALSSPPLAGIAPCPPASAAGALRPAPAPARLVARSGPPSRPLGSRLLSPPADVMRVPA